MSATSSRMYSNTDVAESTGKQVDKGVKDTVGVSFLHLATVGSIGASIVLYLMGKKQAAIFVGLWPPTFQALKAVLDHK